MKGRHYIFERKNAPTFKGRRLYPQGSYSQGGTPTTCVRPSNELHLPRAPFSYFSSSPSRRSIPQYRADLSTSTASTTPSPESGSSGDDEPGDSDSDSAGLPRFDAAADALIEAAGLLYKFFYAYAVVAFGFLHAHAAVAYEFLYAHALVAYEFVYAYATVAAHEALAVLEKAYSWARSAWQGLDERTPASVKRAVRRGFFPAVVAVGLSLLLVLPAYWAVPRGGAGAGSAHRLSAQDWQVSRPW